MSVSLKVAEKLAELHELYSKDDDVVLDWAQIISRRIMQQMLSQDTGVGKLSHEEKVKLSLDFTHIALAELFGIDLVKIVQENAYKMMEEIQAKSNASTRH